MVLFCERDRFADVVAGKLDEVTSLLGKLRADLDGNSLSPQGKSSDGVCIPEDHLHTGQGTSENRHGRGFKAPLTTATANTHTPCPNTLNIVHILRFATTRIQG